MTIPGPDRYRVRSSRIVSVSHRVNDVEKGEQWHLAVIKLFERSISDRIVFHIIDNDLLTQKVKHRRNNETNVRRVSYNIYQ